MKRPSLSLVLALCLLPAGGDASTINYASSLNRTNLTSTGAVFDESFRFELGVFKDGFVPTAENTAEWLANWAPAQRTAYNTRNRWFTSNFIVTNNAAPFTVGAKGYVWGFSGGEWILFRATNWTWPAPNPDSPLLASWTARNATSVVLGEVQTSGPYHMKTTSVAGAPAPVVPWEEWRSVELAAAASPNGTPQDLNANGVPDVLDYALHRGADPEPGRWLSWGLVDGKRYLEMRIPRRRDRQATFVVEVSPDLKTWTSGETVTEVVEDSAAALVVRDRTPVGEGGDRRFMRVRTVVGA